MAPRPGQSLESPLAAAGGQAVPPQVRALLAGSED